MDRRAFSLSLASIPLVGAALSPAAAAPLQAQSAGGRTRTPIHGASTFSQVGKELRPFAEHKEATLAEQEGSGFLDHLWFGGDFTDYTKIRLRFYIDGETTPSIDTEMGLAAGIGFVDPAAPWGTQWIGKTGAPSGIYLNYRVPFAKHIRITGELPPGVARDNVLLVDRQGSAQLSTGDLRHCTA